MVIMAVVRDGGGDLLRPGGGHLQPDGIACNRITLGNQSFPGFWTRWN